MDVKLSRRVAKVLNSEKMLRQSVKERYDFVEEVSKYDSYDDLPRDLKAKLVSGDSVKK
jgi:hypothetical protein